MDKTEYHAVIKFFVKEGLTPNEINSKFIKVYVIDHILCEQPDVGECHVLFNRSKTGVIQGVRKVAAHL